MGALDVELTPAEVQQISTKSDALRVYGDAWTRATWALDGVNHLSQGVARRRSE